MPTPDHAAEARQHAEAAERDCDNAYGDRGANGLDAFFLGRAQVHATLAVAHATLALRTEEVMGEVDRLLYDERAARELNNDY